MASKVGKDGDRVGALAGAVDPKEEAANDAIKREAESIEMPMRLPTIIVNNYTIITGPSLRTKPYQVSLLYEQPERRNQIVIRSLASFNRWHSTRIMDRLVSGRSRRIPSNCF